MYMAVGGMCTSEKEEMIMKACRNLAAGFFISFLPECEISHMVAIFEIVQKQDHCQYKFSFNLLQYVY
jgi:hypothetical protein